VNETDISIENFDFEISPNPLIPANILPEKVFEHIRGKL